MSMFESTPESAEPPLRVRRVLIALDAPTSSRPTLEIAAQVAAQFGAELSGLFVEDVNLLRLAELPFASEVRTYSCTRCTVNAQQMERQFRAQASQMRRLLRRVAERQHLAHSFHVARGTVASEVHRATTDTDLVIVDKASGSTTRARETGTSIRSYLRDAPRLTLIVQRDARLKAPVVVVYDGTAGGKRALAAATRLVHTTLGQLTVAVVADPEADNGSSAAQLQREAAAWLHAQGLAAYHRRLPRKHWGAQLAQWQAAEDVGCLVLPSATGTLTDEELVALLDDVNCPVLLVR